MPVRRWGLWGVIAAVAVGSALMAAGGAGLLFQATFKPSSGTARTAFSKLSDQVGVKDYGVTGDGTTDDTTAIQAAITAAAGKTLRFPSGTYKYTTTLTSAGADSAYVCDGLCTLTPSSYSGATFTITHNRVVVRGFTFSAVGYAIDVNSVTGFTAERNRVLSNTAAGGLGIITNSSEIQVLDNVVDSGTGICLSLHGDTDSIVRGNIFTLCTDDAIAVRALTNPSLTNENTVIADNVIDDAGKAGIKLTVETSSTAGSQNFRASITGNVIKKWGRLVAEAGISINNLLSDGSLNQNITVANNVLESANRTLENSYISAIRVKDVAITGNTMRGGVNASGIVLQNSDYATVTGNVIANPVQVSVATNIGGITLLTTNHSTVIGNTIRNPGVSPTNTPPGIYAESSQYNVLMGNITVDDRGGSAVMPYGIHMSSNGATKDDFNVLIGNISSGYTTLPLIFNTLQQHQIALGNHDGLLGGITLQGTAATKGSGTRNASTRNITRNSSVAPVDCGGAGITSTVTQVLDGAIFTCATAQNLTMARADGSSGLVQALPGTPAVGDIFEFVMSSTAAANFTLVAGTNGTLVGNAVVNNSSRVVTCRITAITLNSETITCYL